MNLIALPAFTDNDIWMLHDGLDALMGNPGEAAPVIRALDARRLGLAGILVTHQHGDPATGRRRARVSSLCDEQLRSSNRLDRNAPKVVAPAAFAALRQWKNQFE